MSQLNPISSNYVNIQTPHIIDGIHLELNTKETQENRQTERRNPSINALLFYLYKGTRVHVRRDHDVAKPFYIDIYETWAGLTIIIISFMSVIDSLLTLQILDRGGTEVNPLMIYLLGISTSAFIYGKIAITTCCLIFLLIHIKFKILGLFSMSSFLVSITCFYALLIVYELNLLSSI